MQVNRTLRLGIAVIGLILCWPSVAQKQNVVLTEGTNISVAVSPDGESLAFDLQGTLWVLPSIGGVATAITDYMGDVRQPHWSPDGKRLAFQSYRDGNWHVWSVGMDGSDLQQLTTGSFDDREPQWSPDGKRIVFSSDRDDNYDIWLLEIVSGELTQLTDNPANDYQASWASDGESITFVSERSERGVYTLSIGGGELKLVHAASTALAGPTFSPSGNRLVVQSYDRGKGVTALSVIEMDGGDTETVSAEGQDVFPFRVSWASESTIYFGADGGIWRRDIGSGEAARIPFEAEVTLDRPAYAGKVRDFDSASARPALGIVSPAVSPEGSRVAFTALGNLWVVSREGAQQVTDDPFVQAFPSWSPDGGSLAYVSDRNGTMGLWTIGLKSGERENLLSMPGPISLPSWSPDGKTIAYYMGSAINPLAGSLHVLNLASGETKAALKQPIPPTPISWSGQNTAVITMLNPFSSRYREGVFETARINVSDGSVVRDQLSPNRTVASAAWSSDGRRLAYIENGGLHVASVDENGKISDDVTTLDSGPADTPSWAADSNTLVYMSGVDLTRVEIDSGSTSTIPVPITWSPDAGEGRLVVHAGRLFNGRDLSYAHDVDIVIDGNRIVSVAPHDDSLHSGDVIDASNKTVIPGLTEMHGHQSIALGEKQGRTWLAFGVTTVREPGADAYDARERKESWASGQRPGPREFFSGRLMDGNRVYYSMAEGTASTEHIDAALERARTLEYDMIKTYVRLPDAMQQKVAAFAHGIGIPTSSHELFPAAAYGMDAVEHAGATSRRGYSPKISLLSRSYGDVVELLSASGMAYTPTLVFSGFGLMLSEQPELMKNRQFLALYGETGVRGLQMRMARASAPSASGYSDAQGATSLAILRKGGRVTTGTDAPFFPYGYGLHIEIGLLVRAGFTPFEALRSATLWPAEAIGVGDDLGSIEAGKLADLVILNGDPAENIAATLSVVTTIKNGVVFEVDGLLEPGT